MIFIDEKGDFENRHISTIFGHPIPAAQRVCRWGTGQNAQNLFSQLFLPKKTYRLKKIQRKICLLQKIAANNQNRRNDHPESAKTSPGIGETITRNDQIVFN